MSTLLSRTQHHDKDERYMAVMDLRSCLDLPLPAVDLARVQSALIDRLRDASADVQALSAGSFGPLAAALSPLAAAQLAQQLASLAVSESVDLREVFGQALAAVATVPEKEKATAVARSVVPELLLVLEDPGTAFAARAGLLQLLAALLRTSGADFAQLHPRTKERLLAEWHGMDAELRRVAASALGSLAAVADLPLVESLVRDLLADIGKGLNSVLDLQAIAAVCRNAGDRIGAYFAEIVPLLEGACEEDGDRGVEDTVEILELALLALSSLVGNRSDEISPFVERILLLAFRFISYDPFVDRRENSAFAQDGHVEETEFAQDDGWGDEADADWEDGNFEVEVLLEEQDESWKVRLASAEVVSAFLGSGDNSQRLFEQVLVNLVSRLHDPDSKVRREIFRAICKLLWYCTRTQQPPSDAIGNILDPLTRQGMPFFAMKYEETALYLFVKAYSPQLIQKVIELFTEDSITAKQGCVSILFELASIFPIENLAQLTTVSEIIALSIRNSDVEILLSGLKLLIILLEQYGFSLPLSLYEISPSIQIRPLTLPNVEHITDSLCFALRNPNVNIRVLGLISVSSLAMSMIIKLFFYSLVSDPFSCRSMVFPIFTQDASEDGSHVDGIVSCSSRSQ